MHTLKTLRKTAKLLADMGHTGEADFVLEVGLLLESSAYHMPLPLTFEKLKYCISKCTGAMSMDTMELIAAAWYLCGTRPYDEEQALMDADDEREERETNAYRQA